MATLPTPAPAFDPAAWFAAWSDNGGAAALFGDRLWIGRTAPLDREAHQRLNRLRGAIHRPDAARALARLLRAHSGLIEQEG